MGWEGFFAVTDALANQISTHKACNTGVDMHHGAACEVERAPLPNLAGCRVQTVHQFRVGVRIRTRPEPHHVCDWDVAEGKPDDGEDEHGREFHALSECAHDQRAGDACESCLKRHEHDLGNDDAFAKRCRVGERASDVIEQAVAKHSGRSAEVGVAFGERKAIAVDQPQHHNQREHHENLHEHRQHVFRTHEATVEQCEARHRHHDDEQRRNHHPGGVAFVRLGCFCSRRCGSGRGGTSGGCGSGRSGFRRFG